MIEHEGAPLVPEIAPDEGGRVEQTECCRTDIREDIDALRVETPFVPLVSGKESETTVSMRHTD